MWWNKRNLNKTVEKIYLWINVPCHFKLYTKVKKTVGDNILQYLSMSFYATIILVSLVYQRNVLYVFELLS